MSRRYENGYARVIWLLWILAENTGLGKAVYRTSYDAGSNAITPRVPRRTRMPLCVTRITQSAPHSFPTTNDTTSHFQAVSCPSGIVQVTHITSKLLPK